MSCNEEVCNKSEGKEKVEEEVEGENMKYGNGSRTSSKRRQEKGIEREKGRDGD